MPSNRRDGVGGPGGATDALQHGGFTASFESTVRSNAAVLESPHELPSRTFVASPGVQRRHITIADAIACGTYLTDMG